MSRSIATTAILALVLAACARFDAGRQVRAPEPAYVPSHDAAQAPLLGVSTVTGDTIREED